MTTQSITVEYDIACAACNSVWEAFAFIVQELPVDDDTMIVSARHKGYAPNGCPILEVVFGNIDIAKGFTAVYLGCADADDSDVDVYLGIYEMEVA